jgi:hypothetical protein
MLLRKSNSILEMLGLKSSMSIVSYKPEWMMVAELLSNTQIRSQDEDFPRSYHPLREAEKESSVQIGDSETGSTIPSKEECKNEA